MNSVPRDILLLATAFSMACGGAGCSGIAGGGAATKSPSSALAGAAQVGAPPHDSTLAGSAQTDSTLAGSAQTDSTLAGSAQTGSTLAGSAQTGSTLAGSNAPAGTPVATHDVAAFPVQGATDSASRSTPPESELPRYSVHKAVHPQRKPVIPPVLLSAGHAKLSLVNVGEPFPPFSLPRLGGARTDLLALRGQQATVVLFWSVDRWMARTALTDMQRDISNQFDARQVAVVGIAVRQPTDTVQAALNQFQVNFPQLLDSDGRSFATLGSVALPRLYVLDRAGMIVWFDIEYSEATRRDLWQTLRVLTMH